MSGISTGTGIFSGIDTSSLISQLLQIEARPKQLFQQRVVTLQSQQAAYLDINSRLSGLRSAAQKFRISRTFDTTRAVSSAPDALSGSAGVGAAVGSYTFVVDRLVNTKQYLSRGFASNTTPVGATSFTFESELGRLDRDTELSQLNGGQGINRGRIVVTDSSGASATIDLSRVATVNEVLDAINANGTIGISASVDGDHFVLTDTAGGNAGVRVQSAPGFTTAESLGLAHAPTPGETTVTGSAVFRLSGSTQLSSLNDGNGIQINNGAGSGAFDFTVAVTGQAAFNVNLGTIYDGDSVVVSGPATTVQDVIDRINTASGGQVTASIKADGSGIQLASALGEFTVTGRSGAAVGLGIVGTSQDVSGSQVISGARVMAGLNSTLARNLRGGAGLTSGDISITTRSGSAPVNFTISTGGSVSDIIREINSAFSGGQVVASLDSTGTGIRLTDTTGGTGNFIVTGAGAEALGIATEVSGLAASSVNGARLQHRYISESTLVSSLNGGRGIGTGTFEVTNSNGQSQTVSIDGDTQTIGDLMAEINSRNLNITARINDNGDGVVLEETVPADGGTQKIRVRDVTGTVAASMRIAGEAAGDGVQNRIDGSFERTVTFTATDSLTDIVAKVNTAGVGARAAIINDGSSGSPFRLSFTSERSGREGRFTVSSAGVDLGLTTLAEGRNSRAFFGSDDPANAVLLSSTTNTLSGVVQGVTIDLKAVSATPVTLNVTSDTDAIRSAVNEFVTSFNGVISRIDGYSTYDPDTQRRGTLLGEGLAQQLRASLYSMGQGTSLNVSGQFQTLASVGIRFNSNGELEVNSDRLQQALEQDPAGVRALFTTRVQDTNNRVEVAPGITANSTSRNTFSSLGIAERIGELASNYIDPVDGLLTQRKNTIDTQIGLQRTRISDVDARLVRKRAILERQFLSMEQALGQLQSQQTALGGIRAIGG